MALYTVTGAYGYSGKYIARRLLDLGHEVRTLTNSPNRPNPFAGRVQASPFHFDAPEKLAESLCGTDVLYNTYWVRFNHDDFTHSAAVRNTLTLFQAAREAGVRRIVHVSITNPALDSDLEYFRGKAELEKALAGSGIAHAILRPAVLFGDADILVNNIAWVLRNFPIFGIFGNGRYRIQPIHVDDFAAAAVAAGQSEGNQIIEGIGPETFTFRELVQTIGEIIGRPRPILSVPPALGHLVARITGSFVGDVILTREEIEGLMRGLLCVDAPPAGTTRLTEWARQHADALGRRYASELARRRNRLQDYETV